MTALRFRVICVKEEKSLSMLFSFFLFATDRSSLTEQVDRILLFGSHKLSGGIMNTVCIACCCAVHAREH